MDALNWKYYIVYCVWLAFEFGYLFFTVIETKGKNGPLPLEEIAALFDGQEGSNAIGRHGAGGHADAVDVDSHSNDEKLEEKHEELRAERV
jgi:hypothetical protein